MTWVILVSDTAEISEGERAAFQFQSPFWKALAGIERGFRQMRI